MIQQFLSWVYIQNKQKNNILKRYMKPNFHCQEMQAT